MVVPADDEVDARDFAVGTVFAKTELHTPLGAPDFPQKMVQAKMRTTDGICSDAQDNIYVTDMSRDIVLKVSPKGEFLTLWGGSGETEGRFANPRGIAIDRAGDIWVTDEGNRRIVLVDLEEGTKDMPQGQPGEVIIRGPQVTSGYYKMPDETAKTITVSVSGDTTAEPDEGFSVTLSNASGGAQIATEREAKAARWDGMQAGRYSQASARRVDSTRAATLAGQHSLFDLNMFNQWLNAHAAGDAPLAQVYERRFRPEFRPAFEAWLAKDPFNNPDAPPGPLYMKEYVVSEGEEAKGFADDAERMFAEGETANQNSDNYVLNGVFLATVLFFIAIGERFDWAPVRIAILVMAAAMLIYGLYHIAIYPIL